MTTDVWFVMLPGVLALDMTGPAETFALADAFRLHYIGPEAEVPTSIGLTMGNIAPLPETLPEGSLLVLPRGVRLFAFLRYPAGRLGASLADAHTTADPQPENNPDVRLFRFRAGGKSRAVEWHSVHHLTMM